MGYRENDADTRKYKAKFSVNEWIGFRERLANLIADSAVSERDAKILTELIINQISTAKLAYLGRTDENYSWLQSNQGKPMSTRRIQQILTDNFPEFHLQTTHKQNNPRQNCRHEQQEIRKQIIKEDSCCSRCGSKENLELHHMIPLAIGGDNDNRNLTILCKHCHQQITNYDNMIINKLKREINKNGNIVFLSNNDK